MGDAHERVETVLNNENTFLMEQRRLFDASWDVARTKFLGDATWRGKILRDAGDLSDEELKGHVCAGLNYPPSQVYS